MPVGRFALDVHGESKVDLGRVGRPVRGAADHQPHPGLRQRLSQPRPRLHPAGRDAGLRHGHRDDPRRAFLTANDRGLPRPDRGSHRAPAPTKAPRARAAGQQHGRFPWKSARSRPYAAKILADLLKIRDPLHEWVHLNKWEIMGFGPDQPRRRTVAAVRGASSPCRGPSVASLRIRHVRTRNRSGPNQRGFGIALPSFYAAMRILPARAARRDVPDLQPSAVRSTTSPILRSVTPSASVPTCSNGGRTSTRSTPAGRRRIWPAIPATIKRFDLQREDFLAIIDGMEMDAREDIRAPDWTTLDLYCDRVASAVGRLSCQRVRIEAR